MNHNPFGLKVGDTAILDNQRCVKIISQTPNDMFSEVRPLAYFLSTEGKWENLDNYEVMTNRLTPYFGTHKVLTVNNEISDEEIQKAATNYSNFYYEFRAGAQWYKEQLKNI